MSFLGGNVVWMGILASLAAGLATGVGAFPILLTRNVSPRLLDAMLGFAAGIMLAATAFSLLLPAMAMGRELGWGPAGIVVVLLGLLAGAVFLSLLDRVVPHLHFIGGPEGPASNLRRIWLLILAITLHNLPEGLAVGVGFGSGDLREATVLAIAIGLQNMPEGLAVALPLLREGYSRGRAIWYATLSGLVEPVSGVMGVLAVQLARPVLPVALAFAAGAMLFVVSDEIIPETHRRGYEREGTFGVIIGFAVMMLLDNLFG